jgi:murein DD-endopeptidase MepM/ murein hydrolase activator NlpD
MLKNKKSNIKNQNCGIPASRDNFLNFTFYILIFAFSLEVAAQVQMPLVRVADVNVGESQTIELHDGSKATIKLLDLKETRDTVCHAVRRAVVTVEVNGRTVNLVSSTYHLPVTVAGVQIDCPVTKGYCQKSSKRNAWGLVKDARLRLWPAGSPWIKPGTFLYPAKQRWFATDTQMANVPVFVDGGERPGDRNIYYHYGLDFGGAEGMVDVVAATDGLVVSAGTERLPGYEDSPVSPRYDVIYTLDNRGWFYRYSHLYKIDESVKPGRRIKMGQKIGVLGKEGGSGGWSHLHFDINCRQPSGMWGIQNGYAFIWEANQRENRPDIIAVARPHVLAWTGETVELDATRSWSRSGAIKTFEWSFCDGGGATGAKVRRTYDKAGEYNEIVKITDAAGNVDYDFAVVQIIDKDHPDRLPPTIHAAFYPTGNIKPGDDITFKVRSFRTRHGTEVWDFGDGSPNVTVQSDGNANVHDPNGYAVTTHRYEKPGIYIATVRRENEHGQEAITHLHVSVTGGINITETEQGFDITEGDAKVMSYQRLHKSLNGKFKRATYIHPFYGLDGEILTEDFPKDHPHHRGIFWAWHQVWLGDEKLGDCWAANDFYWDVYDTKVLNVDSKSRALQVGVLWKSPLYTGANGQMKPFVRETTIIRVFGEQNNIRKVDFQISLLALEDTMRLGGSEDAKGYGGFTTRIPLPDGLSFIGTDGPVEPQTPAVEGGPWLDFSGHFGNDNKDSGLAILCHQSNPGFPHKWILRRKGSAQNPVYPGREPVPLSREKPLVLRYRLIVHRGNVNDVNLDALQAEYNREPPLSFRDN